MFIEFHLDYNKIDIKTKNILITTSNSSQNSYLKQAQWT